MLLLEDGTALLLENGEPIALESEPIEPGSSAPVGHPANWPAFLWG